MAQGRSMTLNREITVELAREYTFACTKCGATLSDLLPLYGEHNSLNTSSPSNNTAGEESPLWFSTNILSVLSCGHVLCRKHLGPTTFHSQNEVPTAECILCLAAGQRENRVRVYWFGGHDMDQAHPAMPPTFHRGPHGLDELRACYNNVLNFAHHWRNEAKALQRLFNRPATRQYGASAIISTPSSNTGQAVANDVSGRKRTLADTIDLLPEYRYERSNLASRMSASNHSYFDLPTNHNKRQRISLRQSSPPAPPSDLFLPRLPALDAAPYPQDRPLYSQRHYSPTERSNHSHTNNAQASDALDQRSPLRARHPNIYARQAELEDSSSTSIHNSDPFHSRAMPPPPRPTPNRRQLSADLRIDMAQPRDRLQSSPIMDPLTRKERFAADRYSLTNYGCLTSHSRDALVREIQSPQLFSSSRAPSRETALRHSLPDLIASRAGYCGDVPIDRRQRGPQLSSDATSQAPTVQSRSLQGSPANVIPGYRSTRSGWQDIPTLLPTEPQLHNTRVTKSTSTSPGKVGVSSRRALEKGSSQKSQPQAVFMPPPVLSASSPKKNNSGSFSKKDIEMMTKIELEEQAMKEAFGAPFSRTRSQAPDNRTSRLRGSNGSHGSALASGRPSAASSRPATVLQDRPMPGSRRTVKR